MTTLLEIGKGQQAKRLELSVDYLLLPNDSNEHGSSRPNA
jgi:hypothetical protein